MTGHDIETRLQSKGIKPTANRLLVYRALHCASRPLTLADMEELLATVDKSSIFRVLTLFLEHDAVHAFEDGRGVLNYELCTSDGACNMADGHLHFYCESCRHSFCLDTIKMPQLTLPEGFTPHSLSFVVKGECPNCRNKALQNFTHVHL